MLIIIEFIAQLLLAYSICSMRNIKRIVADENITLNPKKENSSKTKHDFPRTWRKISEQ